MLRSYFSLVLKDGSTLTQGDYWPEPNLEFRRSVEWLQKNGFAEAAAALARAANVKGEPRGRIYMIVHQPEIVENYVVEADDGEKDESFTKQVQTERYLLLMRANVEGAARGLKNPSACALCDKKGCAECPEETQILEVLVPDVKYAHRVHGWNDATDIIRDLFKEQNEDLLPPSPEDEDEPEAPAAKPNGKETTAEP